MNKIEWVAIWTSLVLLLSFAASAFITGIVGGALGATTPANTVLWFWLYFLSIPTLLLWSIGTVLIYVLKKSSAPKSDNA